MSSPDVLELGQAGTQRGVVICWHGSNHAPGTVALADANGHLWYIFVTVEGIVRVHNDLPTSDNDGEVIGTQF